MNDVTEENDCDKRRNISTDQAGKTSPNEKSIDINARKLRHIAGFWHVLGINLFD